MRFMGFPRRETPRASGRYDDRRGGCVSRGARARYAAIPLEDGEATGRGRSWARGWSNCFRSFMLVRRWAGRALVVLAVFLFADKRCCHGGAVGALLRELSTGTDAMDSLGCRAARRVEPAVAGCGGCALPLTSLLFFGNDPGR